MYTGCEAMMQPNLDLFRHHKLHEKHSADNTHNRLASHLDMMNNIGTADVRIKQDRNLLFMNSDAERDWIGSLMRLNKKLAAVEKENRDLALKYSYGTHEFLCRFNHEFAVDRQKLKEHLLTMDERALQIRRAKTNEDLQKTGPKYEEAVNSYNALIMNLSDTWLEKYPIYNFLHQRDLIKFHMARKMYHQEMARQIRDWLSHHEIQKFQSSTPKAEKTAMRPSEE